MDYYNKKVIWITGASSGIGEALAYEFSKKGAAELILSARREEELIRVEKACEVLGVKAHVVPLDLTQSDHFPELVHNIIDSTGRIDILINNGGISQRALVHETALSVDRRIMEVNFFGQIALTKAILPYMIEQNTGQIGVMSSLTGKFGFPMRSAYAASKHALHGFFESLALELKEKGIQVTMICPGRIKTQISLNAVTKDGTKHGKMDPGQENGMPVEKCAEIISKAMAKGEREIYIGNGKERFAVYAKRFIPGVFFRIASQESPT
ncbi:MAG: SDR family oxidoreductase [Bacteroidota bacterium]